MKKNILKVAFVAAIAMATGIQVFNTQKTETLSEVAMANVEALADDKPDGDFNCWWDSDQYIKCEKDVKWLGCPCGSHEW